MTSRALVRPRAGGTVGTVGAAVAVAFVVFVLLASWLHGRSQTAVDTWIDHQLATHLGALATRILIDLSTPAISVLIPAGVLGCAALARRWDLAALAVAGPAVATVLCEYVGKPAIGRLRDGTGAFPSGHETGVAAAALVLAIALAQLPLNRRTHWLWRAGLLVWVLAAGVGLVRANYHYATDVLGAIALTIVVVLGSALVIDSGSAARTRRSTPDADPRRSARVS